MRAVNFTGDLALHREIKQQLLTAVWRLHTARPVLDVRLAPERCPLAQAHKRQGHIPQRSG